MIQVSDSRKALAHQRLAAKLLALRTQQLEKKLSRVSDDFVTPTDIGLPQVSCHSCHMKDKLSLVLDYCMTSSESEKTEEILSQVSDDFVTPCDTGSPQKGSHMEDSHATYDEFCRRVEEKLSQVSDNCGNLQESDKVEDKFSPTSDSYVTLADIGQ